MSVCPVCRTEFESLLPGRLCDTCAQKVIAQDAYSSSDLRFVGILAGILGAAIFSMPGAFVGFYVGKVFDRASTGCLAGVILMSIVGLCVGYRIGQVVCLRAEVARQSRQGN
ncbi:MAG: hypothetical protein U0941_10490 [Planctomycetaceae bacterium]